MNTDDEYHNELFCSASECIVKADDSLHFVELVRDFGKLRVEQGLLCRNDLEITAARVFEEQFGMLHIFLQHLEPFSLKLCFFLR